MGENAGISPNAEDLRNANPERKSESIFKGSMYAGIIAIEGDAPGTLIVDCLTLKTTRIHDERTKGTDLGLIVKKLYFYRVHGI